MHNTFHYTFEVAKPNVDLIGAAEESTQSNPNGSTLYYYVCTEII